MREGRSMATDNYGRARDAGYAAAGSAAADVRRSAPEVGDGHYASRYARATWLADAYAAAVATLAGAERDARAAAGMAWSDRPDAEAGA